MSALAVHLDCSLAYISKLAADGVIQRQGGSFPLDQSRVAYLRYLRRERQQSPRAATDADPASAKATLFMGATHGKAPAGFAPLAIGFALVMIHLVSIPVTNTSVNPARSTGPALFVGGWALAQLWLFWLAPLIGGALGGITYRWLSEEPGGVVEGTKR